ncbi:hypothetical protein, partial [Sphingomonas sp. Leaf412]|uniref:hypothetical protein n=1 Tax=Sphingomonas sp. Leaf412 TaxID=1736370 RepID=UPI00138F6574
FYTASHDLLIRLVEDFAALSLLPRPRGAPGAPPLSAILGTALDIDLLPFETLRGTLGDWTSMALWSAICVVNTRHITWDSAAAAQFGIDYVTDELRAPASLAMVARTLAIPYATAWRHAVELERRGLMARQDRGWVVATRHFLTPGIAEGGAAGAHYALRRIGDLVAMGLDPAAAADLYLKGRPPVATFA